MNGSASRQSRFGGGDGRCGPVTGQDAGGWRDPGMVARYAASVDVEDGAIARYFGNGA